MYNKNCWWPNKWRSVYQRGLSSCKPGLNVSLSHCLPGTQRNQTAARGASFTAPCKWLAIHLHAHISFFFQNNQERTLKLNVRLVVSKRESLFLLRGFTWFFFQFTLYWSRLAVIINLVLISWHSIKMHSGVKTKTPNTLFSHVNFSLVVSCARYL